MGRIAKIYNAQMLLIDAYSLKYYGLSGAVHRESYLKIFLVKLISEIYGL